jgi:putative tryptophan/tyrosine transport system substrate-binding protein
MVRVRDLEEAARGLGLQIQFLKASSISEIETAIATIVRERVDALFQWPEAFFATRRVQIATLAAHYSIPVTTGSREYVEAGCLMSYGSDVADSYRQVGAYTGRILIPSGTLRSIK